MKVFLTGFYRSESIIHRISSAMVSDCSYKFPYFFAGVKRKKNKVVVFVIILEFAHVMY